MSPVAFVLKWGLGVLNFAWGVWFVALAVTRRDAVVAFHTRHLFQHRSLADCSNAQLLIEGAIGITLGIGALRWL